MCGPWSLLLFISLEKRKTKEREREREREREGIPLHEQCVMRRRGGKRRSRRWHKRRRRRRRRGRCRSFFFSHGPPHRVWPASERFPDRLRNALDSSLLPIFTTGFYKVSLAVGVLDRFGSHFPSTNTIYTFSFSVKPSTTRKITTIQTNTDHSLIIQHDQYPYQEKRTR